MRCGSSLSALSVPWQWSPATSSRLSTFCWRLTTYSMSYHPKAKDVLSFLQLKVVNLPALPSHKWGAVVGAHVVGMTREYGPVYSFWLFSFERYNGILGAIHTNNHSIEVQMMRKFIASQQLWSMMESTDLSSVDFVQMLQDYNTERGTALELTSFMSYFATLENDDVKGRYVELHDLSHNITPRIT